MKLENVLREVNVTIMYTSFQGQQNTNTAVREQVIILRAVVRSY